MMRTLKKVGKTPDPVIITKEIESMPKLEGQESSIVPAEEPPNYDQSEYEEKESELEILTEKTVDFTKDRSPGAREEIATRCRAEKIFVPNRWGGKTSVLNLYVAGILPSPYLQKLHYNEIGLEDVMQICIRYLNGDDPVGGILDVESRQTYSICAAHEKELISKKQAIMMLEAQACTGSMINPTTGERMRVEESIDSGFVASQFKKHLLLAEQAVFGFDSHGVRLPLFDAMKIGLIPQGMAYRMMEVQFVTGGLICPRRAHRVPTNVALESGLIDQTTLGVLQKRAQNDSYRQLYDSAQDDPASGFRLLYVDSKKPLPEKKMDPTMFDVAPVAKKMTLDSMAATGMINPQLLSDFQAGKVDETQVKEKLLPFIGGSPPIAGLLHSSGSIYSFGEAFELRLVKRSIAIEMLQAQVATGGVLSPKANGDKIDIRTAVQTGLVPGDFEIHLIEAEKAFKGYVLAGYKDPVPLVEAIRVGIVAEMAGTRLLNAQCATGGLVDPAFGYRVPLEVAKQKGLVDNRVLGLLNPTSDELKGYTNPNTGKNSTYEELVQKCTKRNNVLLLPIEDRDPTVHMHQMIFN